jgi:hypothetical protein
MHTHVDGGVDLALAEDLDTQYTAAENAPASEIDWAAPVEGPESILLDEIEAAFESLDADPTESYLDPQLEGGEVEAGKYYDLNALEGIDKGEAPHAHEENLHMHCSVDGAASTWRAEDLMVAAGIS